MLDVIRVLNMLSNVDHRPFRAETRRRPTFDSLVTSKTYLSPWLGDEQQGRPRHAVDPTHSGLDLGYCQAVDRILREDRLGSIRVQVGEHPLARGGRPARPTTHLRRPTMAQAYDPSETIAVMRPTMNGHVNSFDPGQSGMYTPADSPMVTEANTPNLASDAPQYVVHKQQQQQQQQTERFHRIDTLHLKRKLFEAMGSGDSGESEQARSYWQHFGQFVRGKLRREEFVELIAEILDTNYKGRSMAYYHCLYLLADVLLLLSNSAQPSSHGRPAQRRIDSAHRDDPYPASQPDRPGTQRPNHYHTHKRTTRRTTRGPPIDPS